MIYSYSVIPAQAGIQHYVIPAQAGIQHYVISAQAGIQQLIVYYEMNAGSRLRFVRNGEKIRFFLI